MQYQRYAEACRSIKIRNITQSFEVTSPELCSGKYEIWKHQNALISHSIKKYKKRETAINVQLFPPYRDHPKTNRQIYPP